MEITFCEMREKEIVNLFDGKRLGRVVDLVFDKDNAQVLGIVVPGLKKIFSRKLDDIFIPLSKIEKIGEDVLLVRLGPEPEKNVVDEKKQTDDYFYRKHSREIVREN